MPRGSDSVGYNRHPSHGGVRFPSIEYDAMQLDQLGWESST